MPADPASGLLKKRSWLSKLLDGQVMTRRGFALTASVTIGVLVLIIWSLLREGSGFFTTYQRELTVYRQAGLEYCDYVNKVVTGHEEIASKLNRAAQAEMAPVFNAARARRDAANLAMSAVQDAAALQRTALEEALAAEAKDEAHIAKLRAEIIAAQTKAAAKVSIPGVLTAEEITTLREQLGIMMPDGDGPPAIVNELSAAAAAKEAEAREKFSALVTSAEEFEAALEPVNTLHSAMKEIAIATKEAAVQQHMAEEAKAKLLEAAGETKDAKHAETLRADAAQTDATPIDFAERIKPLLEKQPEYEALLPAYVEAAKKAIASLPSTAEQKAASDLIGKSKDAFTKHIAYAESSAAQMKAWQWDDSIPKVKAVTHFLFGGDWITNSSWQDFYGVVPLFTGSLLIALTALLIAMPFSVAAAVYTNQFAGKREQSIIKPAIEFIQAIPSVVLGFIGISVIGDLLKSVSEAAWLQWIPGFPIQERLNIFNAGCLLALMAVPTIYSLAEDAINNVPRAFSEASEALGATKLQTVFRVVVPSASSGILAAMLLGLGRIFGETMVVLLVAGNRLAIPDFSDGPGVVFQPAGTMTGIIAQELGEVSRGESHWQALFMVGILLFIVSLLINAAARVVVRKFAVPRI
jgi:phosphate transport system permease protein